MIVSCAAGSPSNAGRQPRSATSAPAGQPLRRTLDRGASDARRPDSGRCERTRGAAAPRRRARRARQQRAREQREVVAASARRGRACRAARSAATRRAKSIGAVGRLEPEDPAERRRAGSWSRRSGCRARAGPSRRRPPPPSRWRSRRACGAGPSGFTVLRGLVGRELGRDGLAQHDRSRLPQPPHARGVALGRRPAYTGEPCSVGRSAVSMMSLTPSGDAVQRRPGRRRVARPCRAPERPSDRGAPSADDRLALRRSAPGTSGLAPPRELRAGTTAGRSRRTPRRRLEVRDRAVLVGLVRLIGVARAADDRRRARRRPA